ncbi:MAG: class I SAM-dependent methyltransferase [Acidimicrobiia bacterium]
MIANEDMAAAWDGDEGAYWADNAEHFEGTTRAHNVRLQAGAAIAAGERVLDVGCGNGASTRAAARAATGGHALGVDLSSRMLERARAQARAEGIDNVEFVQVDAQTHPFVPESFDVAISSFGCMFFSDPVAAFTNVAAALRPAGRVAMLAWQPFGANEWLQALMASAALGRDLPAPPDNVPGPFGLADPERVREILKAAGLGEVDVDGFHAPVRFGDDPAGAYEFLSEIANRAMLADLDADQRAQAQANLRAVLADRATTDGVAFDSAAWLIRARRTEM